MSKCASFGLWESVWAPPNGIIALLSRVGAVENRLVFIRAFSSLSSWLLWQQQQQQGAATKAVAATTGGATTGATTREAAATTMATTTTTTSSCCLFVCHAAETANSSRGSSRQAGAVDSIGIGCRVV